MARGKRKVVWLHTRSRTGWAATHVAERHGTWAVAVLTVAVPRSQLRRAGRGVWVSAAAIGPVRIVSVSHPAWRGGRFVAA